MFHDPFVEEDLPFARDLLQRQSKVMNVRAGRRSMREARFDIDFHLESDAE